MYFTNGDHRAFESLMWDKPGDQYDSGADGPFPEAGAEVLALIARGTSFSVLGWAGDYARIQVQDRQGYVAISGIRLKAP